MTFRPRENLAFGICVLALAFPTALSARTPSAPDPALRAAVLEAVGTRLSSIAAAGGTECITRTIQCGQTVNDELSTAGCSTDPPDPVFFDVWSFAGVAGQDVTVNMVSGQVDSFLLLFDPDLNLFDDDDDDGIGLNARIQTTLDQTGEWTIVATSAFAEELGEYQLSLACQLPPPDACIPGPETLCLSDNRFRVEVDWRTPQGTSGVGMAKPLTPDTGYFWFFNEENVEMVIKVLDACSFADRFWVFAGGLTNVEVNIVVTDTEANDAKTYFNPLRTPFQPIQDTNAFATCP